MGYYTGMEDYYYHNHTVKGVPGYDLRNQTEILTLNDSYSTFFYGNETLRIIDNYHKSNQDKPLFIYVPWQAIHAATPFSASPPIYNLWPISFISPVPTLVLCTAK